MRAESEDSKSVFSSFSLSHSLWFEVGSFFILILILTLTLNDPFMFDFQKLDVYKKSKDFHASCKEIVLSRALDGYAIDQLGRASFSVPLNIAEGSGKFSKKDSKNYFTTTRALVLECVAVLDILLDEEKIFKSRVSNH